jgi:hypothetical protein
MNTFVLGFLLHQCKCDFRYGANVSICTGAAPVQMWWGYIYIHTYIYIYIYVCVCARLGPSALLPPLSFFFAHVVAASLLDAVPLRAYTAHRVLLPTLMPYDARASSLTPSPPARAPSSNTCSWSTPTGYSLETGTMSTSTQEYKQ